MTETKGWAVAPVDRVRIAQTALHAQNSLLEAAESMRRLFGRFRAEEPGAVELSTHARAAAWQDVTAAVGNVQTFLSLDVPDILRAARMEGAARGAERAAMVYGTTEWPEEDGNG